MAEKIRPNKTNGERAIRDTLARFYEKQRSLPSTPLVDRSIHGSVDFAIAAGIFGLKYLLRDYPDVQQPLLFTGSAFMEFGVASITDFKILVRRAANKTVSKAEARIMMAKRK